MPEALFSRQGDEKLLAKLFTETSHPGLSMTPQEFARELGFRVYTEWCMDEKGGRDKTWDVHFNYNGQAFEEFINLETHYLMSRKGMIGSLDGGVPSPEQQLEQRNRVMGALVRRAIVGFKKYDGNTKPWDEEDNMRCNLQPWIGE